MSEAAAREIRKPDEGPLHAFANAMSGGVLLALAGRVCWVSERLAEMAGFESSSDLAELPLGESFFGHRRRAARFDDSRRSRERAQAQRRLGSHRQLPICGRGRVH